MPKLPLVEGAYLARSIIANAQRCVNLYPEANTKDAEAPLTHYPTPGLTILALGSVTFTPGPPTPPTATIVYLPAGTTTFTVPDGVGLLISIRMWGSGADRQIAFAAAGGGGAFSEVNNVTVTPGQVFNVNVPAHNSGTSTAELDNNYTWFGSIHTYRAHCAVGDSGGHASLGLGTTLYNGGDGDDGGGGAAGPNGPGAKGGDGTDRFGSGAGGGGANGGGPGGNANPPSGGVAIGGNGGTNYLGQPGGVGSAGSGGNGINPGSGGAGAGNTNDGAPHNGGNGADDQDRGGGGGGGLDPDLSASTQIPGKGGQPGGGAGAFHLFGPSPQPGGDGQIRIEWNS